MRLVVCADEDGGGDRESLANEANVSDNCATGLTPTCDSVEARQHAKKESQTKKLVELVASEKINLER